MDWVIHASKEHNHLLPDDAYIELRKCQSYMKKRAWTETTSIPKIFQGEISTFFDAGLNFVSNEISTYDQMGTALYRSWHRSFGVEKLPTSAEEITLSD